MSDALYHDAILALAKDRRHAGRLEAPTHSHTSDNPLCGDRVTIDIDRSPDGSVRRIGHLVRGCVLCQAAAAALAASLEGQGSAAFAAAEAALTQRLDALVDEGRLQLRAVAREHAASALGAAAFCPTFEELDVIERGLLK